MSYNRVILLGNITRDIETRTLPSGAAVAQVGLAVNRSWKNDKGEKQEEVCFVDCEAFGKTAENVARFFGKGKPILIEGRLKLDQWKDKTSGENRSKMKVVIESWQFVGGGGSDAPAKPVVTTHHSRQAEVITPDDVPF